MPTVRHIAIGVHAFVVAGRLTAFANRNAATLHTLFAFDALPSTVPTVGRVFLQVHTLLVAGILSAGAICDTDTL